MCSIFVQLFHCKIYPLLQRVTMQLREKWLWLHEPLCSCDSCLKAFKMRCIFYQKIQNWMLIVLNRRCFHLWVANCNRVGTDLRQRKAVREQRSRSVSERRTHSFFFRILLLSSINVKRAFQLFSPLQTANTTVCHMIIMITYDIYDHWQNVHSQQTEAFILYFYPLFHSSLSFTCSIIFYSML